MRLMTRLSVAFSTAAVLAMSFAGVGSASAHAAAPVRALDACPDTYSADLVAITPDFQAAASAAAGDKLGPIALKLIQLRYKYEDSPVPAGCEAQQKVVTKALALFEDGALLTLGAIIDTKNGSAYVDFVQKVYVPRSKAMSAAAASASAPAAKICPDAAFTQKVGADFTGLSFKDTETDPAVIGAFALNILALRYAYEDMTAPAGCEGAQQVVTSILLLGNDQLVLTMAKLGDKANAATYDAFIKKDLNDRGQKALGTLGTYLDLSAMMAATAAPTAAK